MFPTEILVDYSVLRDNFRALQAWKPGCGLAPIIKSDAYGHGLVKTANAFIEGGARRLAVFRVAEALKLRDNGISCPIWVLLGALPDEAEAAVKNDLTLACFDWEQARALSASAGAANRTVNVHLAVDTGMGRLGVLPRDVPKAVARIMTLPGINLRGIFSHMAKAGEPGHPVTKSQVESFCSAVKTLPPQCVENHLCASTAWIGGLAPELPFARPGICLYAPCTPAGCDKPLTKGAMTLRTKIVSLKTLPAGHTVSYNCIRTLERDSLVGIAPLGYEDGYNRRLSNKGYALVHGCRVEILGTVCMSMIMLDLTDVPGAAIGDEAVFLGRQGTEEITIDELASLAGTVPHELLCAFGKNRID